MKNFLILLLIIVSSCSEADDPIECKPSIVNNDKYLNSESDEFTFKDVDLESQNCLKITVIYGGGCGEVSATLVDSGDVLESDPAQRNLRFLFTDNDECEKLKERTFYFDLTNLQIEDDNRILLNFQNIDQTVLYEY
ncbi:hypothetical protein [Salinimicrobium flavum]|uniref:Uncharacterized protein n=1 Tax=Salinimicrobium flavum TaxID=1737065 RepID=A0ABW5IYH8_9FLAO